MPSLLEEKNIAGSADGIWLNSHFLHWWLLPSLHVHDSWLPHLVADAALPLAGSGGTLHSALHQHWSSQLLEQQVVDSAQLAALATHPVLPVCIAEPTLLHVWLQHAGMLMGSTRLRRCIDRSSRMQVQQALGEHALDWVVRTAPQLHTGLSAITELQWHGMALDESMRWLGAQLLLSALEDAPSVLRERVQWQLPMQWLSLAKPDAHWPTPTDAAAISLQLMNTLDSVWLSSLPKTR